MVKVMNETLQMILQAGALGVLVLVLAGIGYLLIKVGPQVTAFLTGLVKEQAANREALTALTAEIRASNAALNSRIELAETRMKSFVDSAAVAVQDTVRERASNTGEQMSVTVDRAVEVLRRQPTDPNLPPYNNGEAPLSPHPLHRDRLTPPPIPPRAASRPGDRRQ